MSGYNTLTDLTFAGGESPWLLRYQDSYDAWIEARLAAGKDVRSDAIRGSDTVVFSDWSSQVAHDAFVFSPPVGSRKVDGVFTDLFEKAAKLLAANHTSTLSGKPAPAATVRTLEGADRTLDELRAGGVLVIDFWATWCGPCIQSLPKTAAVAQEFAPRGVRFVALNLAETEPAVRKLIEKRGFTMPIALDEKGLAAKAFNVTAMPTSVIIDRDGIVRDVTIGAIPDLEDKLRAKLEELALPKP